MTTTRFVIAVVTILAVSMLASADLSAVRNAYFQSSSAAGAGGAVSVQPGKSAFSALPGSIGAFQAQNGGFRNTADAKAPVTLEATAHALFLSALYGRASEPHVRTYEAARYLASLQNGDYGYGKARGRASDLTSVYLSLLGLSYVGQPPSNPEKVAAFVNNNFDSEKGMYHSLGYDVSIKASAHAVLALQLLQQQPSSAIVTGLHATLDAAAKSDGSFDFDDSSLSKVAAIHYAVTVAAGSKYTLKAAQNTADLLACELDSGVLSLVDTQRAIGALKTLKAEFGVSAEFDVEACLARVQAGVKDVVSAGTAHLAFAQMPNDLFANSFVAKASYEVLDAQAVQSHIPEGTQVKPVLRVSNQDGLAHENLAVSLRLNDADPAKLAWDKSSRGYQHGEFIDTKRRLGKADFAYSMAYEVAGLGKVELSLLDAKTIGYGVEVNAEATLNGRRVEEGEAVSMGTEFDFALTLSNKDESNIRSGDFKVHFAVLDASDVVVHEETKAAGGEIAFGWTLAAEVNMPSGAVKFRFQVSNAGVGVHTTVVKSYAFTVPMVASQIVFTGFSRNDAAEYKLGETVQVSMVPASTPDLRSLNAFGVESMEARTFVMDVKTVGGYLLASSKGVGSGDQEGHAKYTFDMEIASSLDMVGTSMISFRYETAEGESVELQSYDSFYGELFEDTSSLNFTVEASLVVDEVTKEPQSSSVVYGTELEFGFGVKDTKSGVAVKNGKSGRVEIALQYAMQNGKLFTSMSKAAVEERTGGFAATWVVDPNAVRGKAVLSVLAKNADGVLLPLTRKGSNKAVSYAVEIGGDIDVQSQSYSTSTQESRETVFAVEFDLFCKGQKLRDAQLVVDVVLDNGGAQGEAVVQQALPVLVNESGSYQVSWALKHEQAPTGNYQLQFYREVDMKKQQQSAKGLPSAPLTPVFTLVVEHTAAQSMDQLVRSHSVVIVLLTALVLYLQGQKKELFARG